ncbi:unnamed protein product [Urochloa humidicola]
MEVEARRGTETESRKRVRVPSSNKGDPTTPAAEERYARLVSEAIEALKRKAAEAKGKPKVSPEVDRYALQASQFRHEWDRLWSGYFGSFEDTTKVPPMRFTDEPAPPRIASKCNTLQIFSVKIGGLKGGLQWPLHVFGMVALRDSIDHNRNIIFQRTRGNCQILTEKDPFLALTGPIHAVASVDFVIFEVNLTVKGSTESDDADLSALAVPLSFSTSYRSYFCNLDYTSKLSTIELKCADVIYSVEASISVQVSSGASLGRVHFTASTASIGDEVAILLDSGDGVVPVTGDDMIELSRHVVSVEVNGKLKVSAMAWRQGDNNPVVRSKDFTPKETDRSLGMLNFGFCRMKITVAWSLITVDSSGL